MSTESWITILVFIGIFSPVWAPAFAAITQKVWTMLTPERRALRQARVQIAHLKAQQIVEEERMKLEELQDRRVQAVLDR